MSIAHFRGVRYYYLVLVLGDTSFGKHVGT